MVKGRCDLMYVPSHQCFIWNASKGFYYKWDEHPLGHRTKIENESGDKLQFHWLEEAYNRNAVILALFIFSMFYSLHRDLWLNLKECMCASAVHIWLNVLIVIEDEILIAYSEAQWR